MLSMGAYLYASVPDFVFTTFVFSITGHSSWNAAIAELNASFAFSTSTSLRRAISRSRVSIEAPFLMAWEMRTSAGGRTAWPVFWRSVSDMGEGGNQNQRKGPNTKPAAQNRTRAVAGAGIRTYRVIRMPT